MKKLTVFAILICIAAILFAGGDQQAGGTAGAAANTPITISVYSIDIGRTQPAANNPVFQYLKSKLNVTFTWDILVGDKNQREGTMIAGGQYADILNINEVKLIDAGALIPLEGLIEQYGPRIKEHYKDVWEKMKSEDGHIYHLIDYGIIHGKDQNPDYNGSAFWIQKAVLKDAGYPKIKTVDEYFNLLENYQKKNPRINNQPTIPFVILTHDWRAFELWNPPNFLAGNPNEGNGIVNPNNNYKYTNFFTMDISKRWFQKLNEFDKRNLIDRTTFTDYYDQYGAKIASGRVLGQFAQGWQFGDFDGANKARGEALRMMVPLPIVFDANTRPRYRNLPIPNIGRGMGISVKAKDPVRIIRFINDLLSEEVQRTLLWGIEGKDWQWKTEGGKKVPYRTPEQRTNWQNPTWQEQNRARLMDMFPKLEGSFSDGYPTDLSHYYPEREAMLDPSDKELFAAYGVTSYNELMDKDPPPNSPWFPTWSMPNPPDGSPSQIARSRFEQTMKQRLPRLIQAQPAQFDAMWTAYVREMNDNNIAVYEKYMQEQLNIRLKSWGIVK